MIIKSNQILFVLVIQALFSLCYTQSYLGCYTTANTSFNANPSVLDASLVLPNNCILTCEALNYQLAGLRENLCFCSNASLDTSLGVDNTSCSSYDQLCIGDSNYYCGSSTFMPVYSVPNQAKKILNFVLNDYQPWGIHVFNRIPFSVNISTTGYDNVYIYWTFNEKETSSGVANASGTFSAFFYGSEVGINRVQVKASLENNSNSDFDSKLISFTAPIVIDQVQNATLNCSSITMLSDWVECEVKTAYGSSMVLTINFGDGTSTSFTPQDTQIDSFGIPVPKSIIQNSLSPVLPGFYYLINTVAYYDGIIRSVEIYGDYSGPVYFYLITPNSCSYVRNQNPFECGTYSNRYTFNCSTSNEYIKSQSACRNAHLPDSVIPANFSATFISSEWVQTGFYHVASLENVPIKAGSFIGWYKNSSTSGSIMLDPNCAYSGLPSLRVNGSNFDVLDSSAGFCQFYMNVFVARPNKMSTLKTYSLPGEYTVSATLHNVYGTSTLSQNIMVVGNLTNLTILANNGQPCILNIACNLTAVTIGGLNVSFNWSSTEFQPISTQNTSIYPIFTSAGTFWVNLTAYDEYSNELAASVQVVVSIQNYSLSLQLLNTDSISSLYPDVSVRNLSLLFSTGPSSQYVCVLHIDSSMTFNETIYPNNSVIVYQANRTGDYHITLNCSYPFGTAWFNFTHRVEDPIKNLTLLNNTVSEDTPFQLMASIQSGTNPVVSLWLNGVKDNGFTFNNAQLTGISSPFATALPGLNNVTINAYNNVSNVTVHSKVLVVYSIQNATITCLSPSAVINGITYYAFGTTINCTLNMLSGSDVSARIYAGDSTIAIYSNNFTGQWSSPVSFTHNYLTPGDYQATALLSNALSQVTLTKTIGMVSSVNQLVPSCSQSSVNLGNPVQFWFSYSGTTMSGSNSEVTFWPGDASNATQGPFNLSMNFNTNLSGANLAYTYTAPGIFNVTFLVRNVLGQQAVYSLSVEVIASLSGLYVQLSPPSILLGQTVSVNVYLTQGTNALLNCLVNGVFLTSITRTSTSYLIPDTITYTPSIEGNFTITVVANNSYASISENAVLSVESAVNVNVVTNPANVSIINNLGASSRTITFTINSLNSLASTLNSQYLVDFNDTTPVSLPQYFASTSASLSHTFNTSGTYYVNVTVFNQVSNATIMLKIQILADFSQLYCQPGWCMYPNSGLLDTLYTSSNSVYNIKKEKDLRLRCSWTSDIKSPVDMIIANFASQQYVFTNITSLDTVNENRTYYDSQQAFGYIITISSGLLTLGQSGLMSVTISNSLYSRTYSLNVSIQSSIVLISPTNNQLPIRPRSVYTFKIDFQSLGEPSCASISIQNETPFAIGTSSSDCSTLFSSLPYSGSYRTNGTNTWSFSYQMNTLGLILMKATMKNSISSQTVSQYVTVSNLDCANPSIQLDYYSPVFYQPIVYKASEIVDIIASVSVKCNVTQSYSKQWSLYKVNSVTGGDYQSVDLSSNPTWQNNEIVIQKNSISFGLYRLNFKAIMTASSVSGIDAFQSSVDTFIQIDPSGYVVDSFDGQISQIALGTNQLLSFNPMMFSIDLGTNSALPSDTKFYFYCTVVDNGIALDYPQSYQGVYTDLALFKSNQIQMSSNRNCFNDSNGFSFDSTLNVLTINSAYLVNQNSRLYRFKTQLASLYYQELDVVIKSNSLSPIFKISCNPTGSCVQQSSGSSYRVNPNNQLIINAFCISNCSLYSSTPVYSYNIYRQFKFSSSDTQEKWLPCAFLTNNDPTQCTVLSSTILGQDSTNLTLFSSFFSQNPLAVAWKVEFTSNGQTNSGSSVSSSSSIILSVNQLPTNGSCSVSRNQGYSMDTIFLINCTGWIDPDGQVERYEFYASFKNDPVYVGLGYNSQGWLSTQIPNGPSYDSYNVYLIVKVIDDFGGITAYTSANLNIQVLLNTSLSSQLMGQMLSSSTVSSLMQDMFSGDPQKIIQNVNGLSSMLNSMASSGQGSDFGPSSIASNASFNDLASLRSQAQSNATTIDESSRNVRANVRSTMMAFVSNMSLSDMTSIKMQSSILSMLTQQTAEVDRTSSNNVINKCSDMVNLLQSMSSQETLSTIQDTATNIIAAMSNVASGLSDTVNNKTTTLSSDYLALKDPSTFDSDPETPENNPYTLNSDTAIVSSDPFQRQNLMKQKLAAVNAYKQTEEIVNSVSTALGSRLAVGQTAEIKTPNLVMSISRMKSSASPSTVSQGLGKIVLPSYCSLNPTSTCASETVLLVSKAAASAAAGLNGNNETSVQNSGEISLSFYDSDNNPIGITNSSSPIDLYIPRSITMTTPSFQFVNATNIELHQDSWFIPNGIIISSANASVFIQLKFENSSAGYVLLTKFGATPRFNNSFKDFDDSAIFCPSVNVKTDEDDRFFQYLSNINKTAGFVGLFGFSIREMNDNELNYYCVDGNSTLNYSLASSNNFYSNFWLRTFTTGCYSYNFNTNSWTSYGMEVMADTNMLYTHCTSTHLTNFAGGLQVLPPSIDFAYVFANASFTKNLTIYLTVIIVTIFFILFCIMTYWMDRRDDVKVGFTLAPDNRFSDTYFYEIGVYTGSRKGAATDSIVKMLMAGAYGDTGIRRLIDKNRKPFRRGGIDTFIISTYRPLGELDYIRIWHDNSGQGGNASWYLKFIIVKDLQTNERSYFVCNKWLALEKDDGKIERLLLVASETQLKQFRYLLEKEAKQKFADGHLWFSVFSRPINSSFTRLERATCVFVLLYLTMLMNILYYGVSDSTSSGGLEIGPILVTTEQVVVGIVSNLIIFPPSLILVEMFRRARRRKSLLDTRRAVIDEAINNSSFATLESAKRPKSKSILDSETGNTVKEEEVHKKKQKKKSKPLRFPWWFKIIAYILSGAIIIVCILFIIFKGISLGDATVQKWLASFFISALTSIFLTQPLKIILLTVFCVAVFKKDNREDELEEEDQEVPRLKRRYRNYAKGYKNKTEVELDLPKQVELERAKRERIKELECIKILREILYYSVFLVALYMITFNNFGTNSFKYRNILAKQLFSNTHTNVSYDKINSVDEMYYWFKNTLLRMLRVGVYYNNQVPSYLSGFMNDFSSRLIGYAIIRQIRVENNSCTVPNSFKQEIPFCVGDYSVFSEEKSYFDPGWKTYNSSDVPSSSMERIYSSFKYRSAFDLNGFLYSGKYASYMGGGYVYEMRGSYNEIVGNISLLQELGWIDRQTRAIFVEFTSYNPNIDLFSYCTILFELLPTGNIVKSYEFLPMNLFADVRQDVVVFKFIFFAAYLAFILFFMVREIRLIIKLKKKYVREFWSWVEWIIIGFSWAAFAMVIYRIHSAWDVMSFFEKSGGYGYIKLQYAAYWNQMLGMCLAFCCFFGTLKFFKLLRFYPRINVLMETLSLSSSELVGFGFIFIIVWFSFVQTFFLLLFDRLSIFNTILETMVSCFSITLGVFPPRVPPTLLSTFFYIFYCVFIIFVFLNIFVVIIVESFCMTIKQPKDGDAGPSAMILYFKKFLMGFFGKRVERKVSYVDDLEHRNDGNLSGFDTKTQALIDKLAKVFAQESTVSTEDLEFLTKIKQL